MAKLPGLICVQYNETLAVKSFLSFDDDRCTRRILRTAFAKCVVMCIRVACLNSITSV